MHTGFVNLLLSQSFLLSLLNLHLKHTGMYVVGPMREQDVSIICVSRKTHGKNDDKLQRMGSCGGDILE